MNQFSGSLKVNTYRTVQQKNPKVFSLDTSGLSLMQPKFSDQYLRQ